MVIFHRYYLHWVAFTIPSIPRLRKIFITKQCFLAYSSKYCRLWGFRSIPGWIQTCEYEPAVAGRKSRPSRKAGEVLFTLGRKKSLVVFRVHEIALESFWQFFRKLGMKIKRFLKTFARKDVLVAEINRSTFSIRSKKVVPTLLL